MSLKLPFISLTLYFLKVVFKYIAKSIGTYLMKGLTSLVISMSTNLNVKAYNDILGNCVLLILYQQFGQNSFLF